MKFDPDRHYRRSIRLKDYDCSQDGAYFVTVCVKDHACLFGYVGEREMNLNEYGQLVMKCWETIPGHFPHVRTDEFIIMPNHVHGIVFVNNCRGEVSSPDSIIIKSTQQGGEPSGGAGTSEGVEAPPLRKITLGRIVAYFKYQTAKQINQNRNTPGTPVWQRNYYEHIIRDEKELQAIREYIRYNPLNWDEDEEKPKGRTLKNSALILP